MTTSGTSHDQRAAPAGVAAVRGLSTGLKVANALMLALLVAGSVAVPRALPALGALALPLALALLAARHLDGVFTRGFAIAANVFGALACAGFVLFTALALVRGRLEVLPAIGIAGLFAPVLWLCVLNLRALVGPPVNGTNNS
jgi:hypothetical protein